jgi:ubiquitin-conjugating enzyme E2 Q
LQETYPSTPPVWFADVEDPLITNAVQILSNTSGSDNHVRQNYFLYTYNIFLFHSFTSFAHLF